MNIEKHTYLIMTLDPVHIGTGGYRLGRVDNAIAREPGTNLPKIPGTSLHGAIRSAAAIRAGKIKAAGQKPEGRPHECVIVYTFGAGEAGGFNAGVVSICDARLLLFPIAALCGPVWITTKSLLDEHGFQGTVSPSSNEKVVAANELPTIGETGFNVGWLMLERETTTSINAPTQSNCDWGSQPQIQEVLKRTVIVHEDLFAHLVNSGLEVRTSVAINPETGAAEEGALFTYEAIPRATFLTFDVVSDDYQHKVNGGSPFTFSDVVVQDLETARRLGLPGAEPKPIYVVNAGLELAEYLGIGGMGTRGFGRIRKVGSPVSVSPTT